MGDTAPQSTEAPNPPQALSGSPEDAVAPYGRPKRAGGLFGLLRGLLGGFLQRLRGWGHGLLSYGPLVPGERLLLVKRLRRGAAYGAGLKLVLSSRKSWDPVLREPVPALIAYLRPYKVTLCFMVAGAGADVALLLLQLRYFRTDLSVVPPENAWQHLLRLLFGARPPAKRAPAPPAPQQSQPALPAACEAEPGAPRAPQPPGDAEPGVPAGSPAAAGGLTAGPGVAAGPGAATGSPASSFVDVTSSPVRLPHAGLEGPWSDVPLGSTKTPSSTPEDWTDVGPSGGVSPHPGGSPTAAAHPAISEVEGEGGRWAEGRPPRLSYEQVEGGASQQ